MLQKNAVGGNPSLQAVYNYMSSKFSTAAEVITNARSISSAISHRKYAPGVNQTYGRETDLMSSNYPLPFVSVPAIGQNETSLESTSFNLTSEMANANSTPAGSSFILLNSLIETVAKNNESRTNSKVYVLNGNVLKEVNDVDRVKIDNGNYVCLTNKSNSSNVIKKMKCEGIGKNGQPVFSGFNISADPQKTEGSYPLSSFVQTPYTRLKTNNSMIAFAVSQNGVARPLEGEILRDKLSNNLMAAFTSEDVLPGSPSSDAVIKEGWNTSTKKEQCRSTDSPAVVKARDELIRCRKALIEAAIHPQLPSYLPPAGYFGAMHACEECEDKFGLAESLSNHKNRRCVMFKYACPVCKTTLEFYNRCMFLSHIRSHDTAVKACFLTISVIPANKLNFSVLSDEPSTNNDELTYVNESTLNAGSSISDEPTSSVLSDQSSKISPSGNAPVVHIIRKQRASALLKKQISKAVSVVDATHKGEPEEISHADENVASNRSFSSTLNDTVIRQKKDIADLSCNGRISSVSQQLKELSNPAKAASAKQKRLRRSLPSTSTISTVLTKSFLPENATSTTRTISFFNSSKVSVANSVEYQNGSTTNIAISKSCNLGSNSEFALQSSIKNGFNTIDEIQFSSSDDEVTAGSNEVENNLPVVCRECGLQVLDLTSHYHGINRPLKQFSCNICKFFNPSACALSAHIRMHSHTPPYICPDCGFYACTYDSFLTHVKQVCFYDFKVIRFKCPECRMLEPSVPQFTEHLKNRHVCEVFKCGVCIAFSYSAPIIERHMEKDHPEAKSSLLEGFRCILCPNVLVAKHSIDVHIKRHIFGLQHLRYIYICKFCKKFASAQKSKFEVHFHSCSARISQSLLVPKDDIRAGIRKVTATNISDKVARITINSEQEVEKSPNMENDRVLAKPHAVAASPSSRWCAMCCSTKLSPASNSVFCSMCVSNVNSNGGGSGIRSVNGNGGSNMDVIGRAKRKFKCKFCKKYLNREWGTITNHYLLDHRADFDVGVSKSSKLLADIICGDSGRSISGHSKKVSRKRKLPHLKRRGKRKILTSSTNVATSSSQSSCSSSNSSIPLTKPAAPVSVPLTSDSSPVPKKRRAKCKYKCVKCSFRSSVLIDFREHILQHKIQSNADYQCLKCGECFIIKSLLEKHLIVVHKIKDIKLYYKRNGIVDDSGAFK